MLNLSDGLLTAPANDVHLIISLKYLFTTLTIIQIIAGEGDLWPKDRLWISNRPYLSQRTTLKSVAT